MELSICDEQTQESILPVFWEDNYISLLPGKKRILKARIPYKNQNSGICFKLKGMNIDEQTIKIKDILTELIASRNIGGD
jgi:exo-1,4-beta-D-glucosaminidase